MRKSGNHIKDRIMAWLLALAMLLGSIGSQGSLVFAAAGDDIEVTVNITDAADTTTSLTDATVTFTANEETPVTIKQGETGVLKEGTEYDCEVSCTNFVSGTGKFTPSAENKVFSKELSREQVTITFQTTSNGNEITGINLVVNGEELKDEEPLQKTFGKGTEYTVIATGEGYDEKEITETADETKTVVIDMGNQYADVSVTVKEGDTTLQNARVYYMEGSVKKNVDGSKGTYTAKRLIVGETYEFGAEGTGFAVTSQKYKVKLGQNSVELTAEVADPIINTNNVDSVTYPNTDGTTWGVQNQIEESGYTYTWSSSDTSVATVNDGKITTVGAGTTNISVSVEGKSNSKPFTVNQGTAQDKPVITVEEGNIDKTSVTFTVSDIPQGGDGTLKVVASGDCLKNDVTKEWNIAAGGGTAELSLGDALNDGVPALQGQVTYTITFTSKNYKYNPETKTKTVSYYRTKDITAEIQKDGTKANKLTYGDEGEFNVGITDGGVEGSSVTYKVKTDDDNTPAANREKDIISIDESGKVTIKNAGTAEVTVTRAQYNGSAYDTYWAEAEYTFTVTVDPKELDPINAVTYTQVDSDQRVYDKSDSVKATGAIHVESGDIAGLESGDAGKIEIEADLKLSSADADEYSAEDITIDSYSLKKAQGADEDVLVNYILPAVPEEKIKNISENFVIHKKELTIEITNEKSVSMDGVTEVVGVIAYDALYKDIEVTPENMKISVKGLCQGDTIEGLVIKPISGPRDVGNYPNEVVVDIAKANEAIPVNSRSTDDAEKKNYEFKENGEHKWATLCVQQEKLQQNALESIVTYGGTDVFVQENADENDLVWVKNDEGKLTVSIRNDYTNRYDAVLLVDDDGNASINLTEAGIAAEDLSKLEELQICLAKKKDEGGYKNNSSEVEVPFKLDAEAPTVKFKDPLITEEITAAGQQIKTISFGIFTNVVYSAGLTVEDTSGTVQPGGATEPGSGVKSVETYVWKLSDSDLTEGKVSEKKISDKIKTITDWKNESLDGTYSVKVTRNAEGQADAVEGSYLVLVQVTDNVNNTKVYASNGVVLDITKPSIQVTFKDGENYVSNPKDFYNGDITYAIEVTEGKGLGVSGVAEVVWEVTCDREVWKEYTETIEEDKKAFTKDELEKVFSKTDQTILASECDSNNLVLTVTAKDRAGNVADTKTYSLCIDTKKPTVSVKYDNNSVENGKYFNAERRATVTFTERNFDRSKVTFDLTLENGTKYEKVSLETLNTIEGIRAEWGFDSAVAQGTTEKESAVNYKDSRINVAYIHFQGDNNYKGIEIYCTDEAGNSNAEVSYDKEQKAPTDFIIDTTYPTAKVRYFADGQEIYPKKDEANRIYINKVITAIIEVEEHNFALSSGFVNGQILYDVTGKKVEEGKKINDYQKQANTLKKWTSNGDVRTGEIFEYAVDANYTAKFVYKDLAGNSCTLSKDYFTVDRTAPTGTITVGTLGTWQRFISKITFGLFNSESQKVSLTGDDYTSPVTSVAYTTSYEPMNKSQVAAVQDWTKGKSFSKAANKQFIVYSKITDKAGNVTYLSSNGVILDSTKPGPSITITASKPSHDVYAGNVPFTIQVEDPTAGKTYSGLKSVSYEILNSGKVTQSGNFDAELKPASKRVKSLKKNLSVNAQKNNSNDVVIKVTAVDNAGNTSSKTEKLKIDITKPEISVSYNNNSPLGGKYYKDTRVATVTIRERNFDPNNVRFTITNTDGTRPAISGWTNSSNSGVSDQATHTCTVSFASDGDYTFTLECTDLAGNKAVYGKTDTFTIDKTVPRISVSYDNNAVSNGHYYMAERTATVTITEHNFNAADVKETITASLNGQGITAPSISGFSNNGDTHTATIHYSVSGDYTFNISYTDMAGNPAQAYEGDRFTIDLEKPVIKISGVNKANKGAVNPTVEVTDNNYDGTKVTITLEGTKHKSETKDGSRSQVALGERIRLADLPHTEDADDIYTLTVRAIDKAGNSNEDSYTFSVNRFGSVYTMDKATEEVLENYYVKEEKDLTVTETNTDSLKHQKITCSRDGEIYDLKEGEDYIIEESGTPGSWKVYTYRILKENFEKDGKYVITIYSEDEAENSSSNQGKNKTIEFVVDKTAPTIVITGIEDGQSYREDSHDAIVDAKDNIYLKSLRVEIQEDGIDEPSVYEFMEEELEEGYGVVTQAVKSANNWQTVRAVAVDAAGNECISESVRVLVNSSLLVQFFMNKPLFFGSILILLLILALIAYLIRKKRQAA